MSTTDQTTTSTYHVGAAKRMANLLWPLLLLSALAMATLTARDAYQNPLALRPLWGWFSAMILIICTGASFDYAQKSSPVRARMGILGHSYRGTIFDRVDWAAMLVLVVVALSLRLYRLDTFLPPMHGDEGEKGTLALAALHSSSLDPVLYNVPLFGTRFFGHPTLYFYMQAAAMRILGESLVALRAMNSLFGALIAALLYAIARLSWGRTAGFVAGWLMAVSHTYIHYSRTAMSMIPTAFAITLMVLLFVLATGREQNAIPKRKSAAPQPILPFVWIGLVIGWSQYMYYGSRLLPVLAAVLVCYQLWQRAMGWRHALAIVIGFLVIYLPQGYYFYHHPDVWLGRLSGAGNANGLSPSAIHRTLGPNALWPNDLPRYLWWQIVINGRYFIDGGDGSSFYWRHLPGFDPLTALCIWTGLLFGLTRLAHFPTFVAVCWACLGVFLAGVLTIDSPYGPRLLIAMPAVFLLAAIPIQWLVDTSNAKQRRAWQWIRRGRGVIVTVLLATTLALNYYNYFVRYATAGPVDVPEMAARAILAHPEGIRAYFLTAPNFFAWHGNLRFLARDAERFDVASFEEFRAIEAETPTDKGRLFLAIPERANELERYEDYFPGGFYHKLYDHHGAVRLVSYWIPR